MTEHQFHLQLEQVNSMDSKLLPQYPLYRFLKLVNSFMKLSNKNESEKRLPSILYCSLALVLKSHIGMQGAKQPKMLYSTPLEPKSRALAQIKHG